MTNNQEENNNWIYPGYHHQTSVQVRFKDVDVMGHVNNSNHFTYLELARMYYFNEVVTAENDWKKTGFIIAKVTLDYLLPILLNDKIKVFTRCSRLGNKSFDLEYAIVKKTDNDMQLLARGISVLVCYDYALQKSIPLNSTWAEKVKAFEGF